MAYNIGGLALDTTVHSDRGTLTIKDVREGDYVIGEDGEYTKVIKASEVFVKDVYLITFEDGRFIKVAGSHINTFIHRRSVRDEKAGINKKRTEYQRRNLTTKKMREYVLNSPRQKTRRNPKGLENNFWVPLAKPARFDILETEKDFYTYGWELGKTPLDRKISIKYMRASYLQRLKLLRGFMDVKGVISGNGSVSFSIDYPNLENCIIEIIRSLGGITNKTNDRINVQINEEIFTVGHKADKIKYNSKEKLVVTSVKFFGRIECKNIEVDNETNTFVVNDYIVTHGGDDKYEG